MANYNLTEDQKRVLRQLVRGSEDGKLSRTFYGAVGASVDSVSIEWRGDDRPRLKLIDLQILDKEGFLSLRVAGRSKKSGEVSTVECTLLQKAFEAVGTNFSDPAALHSQVATLTEGLPCAVILTALSVEYQAVRAHLTDLREETHPQGTVYERGKFSSGGQSWQVGIVEIGPGGLGAAIEAEWAITHFNPNVALFIGVAGGIKDVALGDVVAATKVYGYESGKAERTFLPRPEVGKSAHRMIQRARAEARKDDWLRRIKGPVPDPKPEVFVRPIAAGEKVIASIRSDVYKFLRSNYGDALAVEMESHGFLATLHAHPQVHALVIRGISDLIEGKSEADAAGSQEIAARHASAFAFEILAKLEGPDDIPPPPLPPIFNLPHHRNPNFTGRQNLLAELYSALTSGQPAALTQAISGLGGVGKTQLAVEYAYRHTAEYDVVWWVRAEEPATLAADYAALAGALHLPQKDESDQRLVVQAVRHWLARHEDWLLIFDNAPGPEEVRPYLPPGATGHVLVTSRNPAWRGVASPLTVQVWERPESVAFLLKRTGQTDETAADALAEALGDLPLALAQAAAYVDATRTTLANYLDLFRSRRTELWEDERPPLDYPHTVATTWSLAMDRIRQDSPASADLLNLCAYLGPDDIPQPLWSEGEEHLPKRLSATVTDPRAMNKAIAALLQYSLIERTGDALSVHRLVQAVARDRLPDDDRPTWAEAAVRLVDGAFPFESDDVRTWPQCARLLPHALAAAGQAEALEVASEVTAHLLNQAGIYLCGRAQFAEAKAVHEQALAIGEAAFGPDHPKVATDVNNLGGVLQDLGDLDGARAAFERALVIDEVAFGPHHPKVATDVSNLGLVLRGLGDLDGAREAFQRALVIDEAAFGPHHPNVARDVNNLGSVLQDLGDLDGARAAFERALAIWEKQLGSEHPQVAIGVNNLGSVLQHLGDLAEARAAFERALAIDEAAFGLDHPKVAGDVNNLGGVLKDLDDLDGARAAFERALAIWEKQLGSEHPQVAIGVNNLGSVLKDLGDLDGARAHYERALAIWEKQLGSEHPQVAIGVNNLGGVLRALGNLAGARAHYERALAIDEATFGPDHPGVARVVNNLGGVLQALGDLAGAREAFQRALAIREQKLGENHPDTATTLNDLGNLLRQQGNHAEARIYLERALAVYEQVLGKQHPWVATAVSNLGLVLRGLGDLDGAREAFQRALVIDEAAFGPHHPNVALLLWNLGTVLQKQGEIKGAREAYERALATFEHFLGPDHQRTRGVRQSLDSLPQE